MKILLFSLTLLILTNHNVFSQSLNEEYDKKLADSLGADDYGMKSYIFAILKTGPSSITDKEERSKLFKGHMENIITRVSRVILFNDANHCQMSKYNVYLLIEISR